MDLMRSALQVILKGDTAAIILDGVKIVQKSKQQSIENKTEQHNFHLFYKKCFPDDFH
jgi:hypothetical protein